MPDATTSPATDADMIRRAAVAVHNLIRTDPKRNQWAAWVPRYLEGVADRIDKPALDEEESS